MSLAQEVLNGNRLALARLLTQIENQTEAGRAGLDALFPHSGRAHRIGVTGAPGTGKSSLVNQLALYYRQDGVNGAARRVAIVAVDPSSPFTGGAILGDRVRMRDLAGDPGVFIRSMASRGSLGGLAAATSGVVLALDAAGFEVIMIETVGAGQAEVDIARLAHTTLVIEAPGLGDDIQAIKAGILEIADVLVINKADRPGVETTERALKSMLQLAHPVRHVFQNDRHHNDALHLDAHHVGYSSLAPSPSPPKGSGGPAEPVWEPPVLRTVAIENKGTAELAQAIAGHYRFLQETGEFVQRERSRLRAELDLLLREELAARWRLTTPQAEYERVLQSLEQRQISPYSAVDQLLDNQRSYGKGR
jgi:LAO/AO transport system kinase